uniref:F-box protein At4g27050-like n=1 Tax=Erigeron canadensis TaxID=72917 RepID=UPI001CB8EE02|nr:F-box protein At4g27050-like [Erigeron canadensis]
MYMYSEEMKRVGRPSSSMAQEEQEEDRLSSLPDVLLIYILSFIDTKLSIQLSILSKRWVNLWTLLPVLNFNSSLFYHQTRKFSTIFTFDYFIDQVLSRRNSCIKIDTLNIQVTDYKTLVRVFNFALLNCVPNLSIDSSEYLTKYRPISCENSSHDLTSLSLKGMMSFGRFPLFVGLVKLRLERVKIVESEPFSYFPNLEELFLVNCKMEGGLSKGIEVIGLKLLRLSISSCFYHPVPYEKIVLLTPKLLVFELDGLIPMSFEAEVPVVETVYIDCCFSFSRLADRNVHQPSEYQQKENLINIFRCLRNAKYVHLSPSTVKLLSLSQSKLVEEASPFGNLKVLNLIPPPNKPMVELHSSVAAYLLKGSPAVVVKAMPR